MAARSNLVNLDAMIKRADFAFSDDEGLTFEQFNTIPARELVSGGLTGAILRKPDFQRETNHWTPDQVVSLLECYIHGDLIPSVILWRSPSYLFVIDRLKLFSDSRPAVLKSNYLSSSCCFPMIILM